MSIGSTVLLYGTSSPDQPYIPWTPPTIYIPQPIPDPATVEEVRKLRKEVEKLRHTQEGMKKAVEKFLKRR